MTDPLVVTSPYVAVLDAQRAELVTALGDVVTADEITRHRWRRRD